MKKTIFILVSFLFLFQAVAQESGAKPPVKLDEIAKAARQDGIIAKYLNEGKTVVWRVRHNGQIIHTAYLSKAPPAGQIGAVIADVEVRGQIDSGGVLYGFGSSIVSGAVWDEKYNNDPNLECDYVERVGKKPKQLADAVKKVVAKIEPKVASPLIPFSTIKATFHPCTNNFEDEASAKEELKTVVEYLTINPKAQITLRASILDSDANGLTGERLWGAKCDCSWRIKSWGALMEARNEAVQKILKKMGINKKRINFKNGENIERKVDVFLREDAQ